MSELAQENKEKILFDNGTEQYQYSFKDTIVFMAELAREAGEFRAIQQDNTPDDFNVLLRTEGTNWKIVIVRYLLRKVINDQVQPFDRNVAESKVDNFLKNLDVSALPKMEVVITDFFTNIGRGMISSAILQSGKERNLKQMLLSSILTAQSMKKSNENF